MAEDGAFIRCMRVYHCASIPRSAIMKKPTVLCVSADIVLAATRELLLSRAGCEVISILGAADGIMACSNCKADLLVIGHSVPRPDKQQVITAFRKSSKAPIISLLAPHQQKLPEATFGIDGGEPDALVEAVRSLTSAPPAPGSE
jgi:DNA-binding NtrC family response regulator